MALNICYNSLFLARKRKKHIRLRSEIKRSVTEIKIQLTGIPGWLSGLAPAFSPGCDPGVLGLSFALGLQWGVCFSHSLRVSRE